MMWAISSECAVTVINSGYKMIDEWFLPPQFIAAHKFVLHTYIHQNWMDVPCEGLVMNLHVMSLSVCSYF